MSFSSEIKNELCALDNIRPCCYHAQVYGLVLFAHFSNLNLSITTEHRSIYELYCDSLRRYVGIEPETDESGIRKLTAYVVNETDKKKIFDKFGHTGNEASLRINYANLANECCVSSFLRGVFLACGSVSDPNRTYHLEFVVPYKKLCNDLIKIIGELDLEPKYIQRKGNHIVYFKDSESIEDFLAYIGAQNSSLYIMNVKIEKDIKNKVNRKLNFEYHNLDKTLSASKKQIEAIKYIKGGAGFGVLPENLKEIALLRLENPDDSLTDLAEMCDGRISKSGIKHRLDKIIQIADDLKNSGEK